MNMDGGGAHRAVSVERGQFGAQFNAIMPPSATATMTTMTKMTDMPVIIHSWMTLRISMSEHGAGRMNLAFGKTKQGHYPSEPKLDADLQK